MNFGRLLQQFVDSVRHSSRNARELLNALTAEQNSTRRPSRITVPVHVAAATELCELRTLLSAISLPAQIGDAEEPPNSEIDSASILTETAASGENPGNVSAQPAADTKLTEPRTGDVAEITADSVFDVDTLIDSVFIRSAAAAPGYGWTDGNEITTASSPNLPLLSTGPGTIESIPALESPISVAGLSSPDETLPSQSGRSMGQPTPMTGGIQQSLFIAEPSSRAGQPSDSLRFAGMAELARSSGRAEANSSDLARDGAGEGLFPQRNSPLRHETNPGGSSHVIAPASLTGAWAIAVRGRVSGRVRLWQQPTESLSALTSAARALAIEFDAVVAVSLAFEQDPLARLGGIPEAAIATDAAAQRSVANVERPAERDARALRIGHRELRHDAVTELEIDAGQGPPYQTEFSAAERRLRYQLQPRAPPAREDRFVSEVVGKDVQSDVLKRLRFSIAPRGPSLDSAICAVSVSDTLRS